MSQTIKLESLRLVLASAKLRRYTNERTCLLATLTAAPLLHTDCSSRSRQRMRDDAMRSRRTSVVTPMGRGHLAELIARTRLNHGLSEVRKTWGAGLRTLQAEPTHVLHGGAA